MKPLDGIKVVELGTYVAAPVVSRILADMGADVIKIETLTGDQWRTQGKSLLCTTDEENPYFDMYNTGKRCISINIKDADGFTLLMKLIRDADIFLTNTRLHSLKKLGLDSETLCKKYPRLICASIDGYGPEGPEAGKPGFDNLSFWARSGFSRDVPFQVEGAYPLPITSGVGDCTVSGYLLSGILAALFQRDRTGKGDSVHISLYGVGVWVMSAMLLRANPQYGGHFPLTPNEGMPLTNSYECADGEWVIISERIYEKDAPIIYHLLGIENEVLAAGITVENYNHSGELISMLRKAFLKKPSQEWINEFEKRDLVIERLTHIEDILTDEQAWANGFVEKITCKNGNESIIACPPIKLASQGVHHSEPAPLLGGNTVEIMREYGYSEDDIERMKKNRAVL